MKLVFYGDFKLGVVNGDTVVDAASAVSGIHHHSPQDLLSQVIENFPQYRSSLNQLASQGTGVPINSVRLRSPVPNPNNIVAMAVNYMEDGTRAEPVPIDAFHKSGNAVIGNGDTMILPDVPATLFEGEAEMALVIGKRASHVKAADAYDYIFGYLNFIDGSARDLSFPFQHKSRDTFAPMGPWLVTADEISDPQNLQIRLRVNEELKQNFNTSDMAHNIPRVIEWVSSIHALEPGDVIATGTNHRGLSAFQDGDHIDLEIEGLGTLHFNIQDELKRTWDRETRLERAGKGLEGTTPQISGKYA